MSPKIPLYRKAGNIGNLMLEEIKLSIKYKNMSILHILRTKAERWAFALLNP